MTQTPNHQKNPIDCHAWHSHARNDGVFLDCHAVQARLAMTQTPTP
ncbi:hypothetical protein [Helicobacter sp. T3_23-1056]